MHGEDKLETESYRGLVIYLLIHTDRKDSGTPATLAQTENHVFEVNDVRSGDTKKDKILALQRLAKDWRSYDPTIYTEGLATNEAAIGG